MMSRDQIHKLVKATLDELDAAIKESARYAEDMTVEGRRHWYALERRRDELKSEFNAYMKVLYGGEE